MLETARKAVLFLLGVELLFAVSVPDHLGTEGVGGGQRDIQPASHFVDFIASKQSTLFLAVTGDLTVTHSNSCFLHNLFTKATYF